MGALVLVATSLMLLILQHSGASDGARAGSGSIWQPQPDCPAPAKCGNVNIPYPFGIREVQSEARILTDIPSGTVAWKYNNEFDPIAWTSRGGLRLGNHHMVSSAKNRFTAIGCSTVAFIYGRDKNGSNGQFDQFTSLCGSFCFDEGSIEDGPECSGMGCCQVPISTNLRRFSLGFYNYNTTKKVLNFSSRSYAFVVEKDQFKFKSSYAKADNFMEELARGIPIILQWIAGNETCKEAALKESYACVANNSKCIDVIEAPGYRCNCTQGYEGNPYLKDGCRVVNIADINECNATRFPNSCKGICTNTDGSYDCICISIIFLIICISTLLIKIQRMKLEKEKQRFYDQNGGHILYQKIISGQVNTVEIFTEEVLKNATNNFDSGQKLGAGGHGIVYKGILRDNNVVAVKRSNFLHVTDAEEFVQEIIMLSQINHRNVVRLIGCCLEVEVPILVYEFISNGTLSYLIHGDSRRYASLKLRLRIAQESAEALAYLHLSTNRPIIHGDVESLNIMLDDSYTVKVTDFGASRWLSNEAVEQIAMAIYRHDGDGDFESLAGSFLRAMEERVENILDTSLAGASMEALPLLQEVAKVGSMCLSAKGKERPSMAEVTDMLKAVRIAWRDLLVSSEYNVTEVFVDSSEAPPSGNPSSAVFWTPDMQSLEVETLR
ncbi:Os06g0142500 [Oryza sativa Japonica Group]|uniref:Os06g0142500 protein n=1 Tax=Oryza sativa subsp. japonica TaxID=39947 RepID=Q0DEP0_ORYSJ|nr:Os06g0142500 [Oryza sativa Japonica Group]|eukprot:NP_001056769.2 Os06g0142500 [Oryza sativa Japonica Group]